LWSMAVANVWRKAKREAVVPATDQKFLPER
jgi:hypothetical protein